MLWFSPPGLSRKVPSPFLSLRVIPTLALCHLKGFQRATVFGPHSSRPVGFLEASVVFFKYWSYPEPPRATGTASKGFQLLHPWIFRALVSVLFRAILGVLTAQEEVIVPPALPCKVLVRLFSSSLPCPVSFESSHSALSCCQALMFAAFLSYWVPIFHSSATSANREASVHTSLKYSHQLLNGPLPSKLFNLNWLNWFSKQDNKSTD